MTPLLWMGGAPTYERDYDFLLASDIKAVVNVRAERQDDVELYRQNGVDYLQIKTLDVMVPSPKDLDEGVAFIHEHVQADEPVLIHCAKGRGRSATLLAAYLMRHENMTYEEAKAFMTAKRSLVNLQGRHRRVLESWIEQYQAEDKSPEAALTQSD